MPALAELLLEHGIRPRGYAEGSQKLLCPRCSHTRRNGRDPCLSLTIDDKGATWLCHHCEWRGSVSGRAEGMRPKERRPALPARPNRAPDEPSPVVLRWLADRGISEATARRNRIGAARVYMPALRAETDCIAFPYFRDGALVNIKFRLSRLKSSLR
jgi:twinkle protein